LGLTLPVSPSPDSVTDWIVATRGPVLVQLHRQIRVLEVPGRWAHLTGSPLLRHLLGLLDVVHQTQPTSPPPVSVADVALQP